MPRKYNELRDVFLTAAKRVTKIPFCMFTASTKQKPARFNWYMSLLRTNAIPKVSKCADWPTASLPRFRELWQDRAKLRHIIFADRQNCAHDYDVRMYSVSRLRAKARAAQKREPRSRRNARSKKKKRHLLYRESRTELIWMRTEVSDLM